MRLAVDPNTVQCIRHAFCVCLLGDGAEIITCSWYSYVEGQHGCVFILHRLTCLTKSNLHFIYGIPFNYTFLVMSINRRLYSKG